MDFSLERPTTETSDAPRRRGLSKPVIAALIGAVIVAAALVFNFTLQGPLKFGGTPALNTGAGAPSFDVVRIDPKGKLSRLALVLAATLTGYMIFVLVTGAAVSDGAILVSGAPMLALVWALAQRHPDMRLALLCLPLVLFAEATAQRVPLPAARISTLLYPLILAGLVSVPLVLAALISFVTSKV